MSRARLIPAVDALLARQGVRALAARHGDAPARTAVRKAADALREELLAGGAAHVDSPDAAAAEIEARAAAALARAAHSTLRPVINATGVIVHTNLGRAPLARAALDAASEVAAGYSTLEFDIGSGGRGSRHVHAERLLCELTGAEAAVVANNTASAVTVMLAALAAGREVVISRGELVEIGGGFRVPDVMRASGAQLREVGTTNRTRPADYAAAVSARTAALLRVHPSNFRIDGFTERPAVGELAALARQLEVPLLEDLGSGWLGFDVIEAGRLPEDAVRALASEPDVRASITAGAALVAFSGDKLLGGPQCGVLVGRADLVAQVRRHPLMRAVRVDKVTYAALEATLRLWQRGRAIDEVPVMAMIAVSPETLRSRADTLAARLRARGVTARCVDGASTIGGGTTPGQTLRTTLVALTGPQGPDAVLARLRGGTPPVIARIVDDEVCLDLRTVPPEMDEAVAAAAATACAPGLQVAR
jgi:L-seryl-tRNA(Ser) seleniumtransferase